MRDFKTIILGCGSAMPHKHHMPSAQVVKYDEQYFICDAGEGLQYELYHNHIPVEKVKGVFITHIHGDHLFGLIGYIMMIGIGQRHSPLHIYGPDGLEDLITHQIDILCPNIQYEIVFHTVTKECVLLENNFMRVESVRLNHGLSDCFGYIFRERKYERTHLIPEAFDAAGLPRQLMKRTKMKYIDDRNSTFMYNSKEYKCSDFCYVKTEGGRSFAYCTDNSFEHNEYNKSCIVSCITEDTPLVNKLKDVTVLYHEASYKQSEIKKALQYNHSTAKEAATLAKYANVGKLIIGHLSARYYNENEVLEEAQSVFENTEIADENKVVEIK